MTIKQIRMIEEKIKENTIYGIYKDTYARRVVNNYNRRCEDMALKKKEQKEQATEKVNYEIVVTRAKQLESGSVGFDMTVNGIKIYGCFAKTVKSKKTGEDVDLVSFPQYKGTNGNYYDYVWFPMTFEQKEDIIKQINSLLG